MIIGFYRISCKTPDIDGNDLERLKNDICKQIFLMENKFKNVWVTGINSLRDWMKNYEDGYITIRDFKNMHKKLGLQSNDDQTLRLCVRSGICIYHDSMQNFIVLKPQWLTSALAKLLKSRQFIEKKWQLTKEEIISTIEKNDDSDTYQYEPGEGYDLLTLMQRLEICVNVEQYGYYIFPCFLSYAINGKNAEEILDVGDWYVLEVRYNCLTPDIFPKLQAKVWTQQWNILKGEENEDYEPDKSKIIIVENEKKIMIYKKRNSIILALEKNIKEKHLTIDEKYALKAIREKLREINKIYNLESDSEIDDENRKVQEYVMLRGRKNDSHMKKVKFLYSKENLKKISMSGIRERYFPEVDRWYDVADLVLEEYTDDKIIEIYHDYIVSILSMPENEDILEAEKINFMGTGFLIPYKGEWYIICCVHETNDTDIFLAELCSQKRLKITAIDKIFEKDIAIFKINMDQNMRKNIFPKDFLSFVSKIEENDILYCRGYYELDEQRKIEGMYLKEQNENRMIIKYDTNQLGVVRGMSGTAVINLRKRCIIGMICKGNETKQEIELINMDYIWAILEKAENKNKC